MHALDDVLCLDECVAESVCLDERLCIDCDGDGRADSECVAVALAYSKQLTWCLNLLYTERVGEFLFINAAVAQRFSVFLGLLGPARLSHTFA